MEREQPPFYKGGRDIRDRTFEFSCNVVAYCETLYAAGGVGRMMVPQLLDCSTSVPSMLEEARAAESKRDFISKCSIGLKECRETHVRLRICERRRFGPADQVKPLTCEANELVAIIGAIVRNARSNANWTPSVRPRARGAHS